MNQYDWMNATLYKLVRFLRELADKESVDYSELVKCYIYQGMQPIEDKSNYCCYK